MSGLAQVARRLRATRVGSEFIIDEIQTQYELTQKALDEEKAKSSSLESENDRLKDETEIKRKALRWAYGCIWLVPTICAFILFVPSICRGANPNGVWANVKLPELAQVALVTGPMVLLGTIMGFVLKGVLGPKGEKPDLDINLLKILDLFKGK
jgi:hypothetical protein